MVVDRVMLFDDVDTLANVPNDSMILIDVFATMVSDEDIISYLEGNVQPNSTTIGSIDDRVEARYAIAKKLLEERRELLTE